MVNICIICRLGVKVIQHTSINLDSIYDCVMHVFLLVSYQTLMLMDWGKARESYTRAAARELLPLQYFYIITLAAWLRSLCKWRCCKRPVTPQMGTQKIKLSYIKCTGAKANRKICPILFLNFLGDSSRNLIIE